MTQQHNPTFDSALLRQRTFFFLAYLLFFFLSKFSGFLPAYALDDYIIISQVLPNDLSPFFVSQGRFTNAIVDVALASANLRLNDLYIVGLFATAVFSGLFFQASLPFSPATSRLFAVACGALLGSHPYFAEYTTFRQSAFLMGLLNLLCLCAFLAYLKANDRPSARWRYLLLSWVLAVLALGVNQLAAAYLCIALVAYETIAASIGTGSGVTTRPRHLLRAVMIAGGYGVVITAGYLIVAMLSVYALGHSGDGRTELLSPAAFSGRIVQASTLVASIFVLDEVVASGVSKLLVLTGLLIALLPLSRQRISSVAVALAFFSIVTLLALLPVLVSSTWWPVPRTLIVVVFATVATLCLCQDGSKVQLRLAACLTLAGSILFAGHSSALLGNQFRLNRWDMEKANRIVATVQARFPEADRIVLAGTSWYHSSAPAIAQGDLNISALSVSWAIDPLFDEATGEDVQVRLATEDENLVCDGRRAFPDPESLAVSGDEVFVCLAPSRGR